jgi:hypothetical protein
MKTLKNQNHRSLTLAARNEAPRYRAATVRESVPLFFNHRPTSSRERQGLVAPLAEATKAVKPIDRTTLNSWEDPRIVDWVEKTGRKCASRCLSCPHSTRATRCMSSQMAHVAHTFASRLLENGCRQRRREGSARAFNCCRHDALRAHDRCGEDSRGSGGGK